MITIAALLLLLSECKKKDTGTTCIVTSVTELKRKVIFTYLSGAVLTRVSDYSDSTNVLSLSTIDIAYNSYGQVISVNENLESGVRDSITYYYSGSAKVTEKKYLYGDAGMTLLYSRSFILDNKGYLSSDTIYAENQAKGATNIQSYSTYEYDSGLNLTAYANYTAGGNLNYSVVFEYSENPVKSSSYDVARFSFIEHYGDSYQLVFPLMVNLPNKITYNHGTTSVATYTYDLDSNGNSVAENYTVSGCPDCTKTIYYNYKCN